MIIEKDDIFFIARSVNFLVAEKAETRELAIENLKRTISSLKRDYAIRDHGDRFLNSFNGENIEILNLEFD